MNPPVIRAPNGVLADSNDYWSAGKAYYDPGKITVPALLVQAPDGLPSQGVWLYLALAQLAGSPHNLFSEDLGEEKHESIGAPVTSVCAENSVRLI